MDPSSSTPDGSGPYTMHDIVVDYITTHAYASTALALSKPSGSAGATPTGLGLRRGNGQPGNGGASATSTDTSTPTGFGNGSSSGGRNGNGHGHTSGGSKGSHAPDGMDVDLDVVSGGQRDGDVDMVIEEPGGLKGRNKGKGKEGEPRNIDEEALQSIEIRRAILDLLLNGAIVRAMEMLDAHFPFVLADDPDLSSATRGGVPIPGGSRPGTEAYSPAATAPTSRSAPQTTTLSSLSATRPPASHGLAHRPSMGSISGSTIAGATPPGSGVPMPLVPSDHTSPVYTHSTLPAHVRLNLQIQAFIESFRHLAPSSPSTPSSSIGSLASSMHASFHGGLPPSAPGGSAARPSNGFNPGNGASGATAAGGGGGGSGTALQRTLAAAQSLREEAQKLTGEDKAVYLQETKDVCALLAYTDPENSILRGFLDQQRRIALAEQVNRAILRSEGRPGVSQLESISRRVVALWALMRRYDEIDGRPPWTASDGQGKEQLAAYIKRLGNNPLTLKDFVANVWG